MLYRILFLGAICNNNMAAIMNIEILILIERQYQVGFHFNHQGVTSVLQAD